MKPLKLRGFFSDCMVTVYVLESIATKKLYVGMTENIQNRLKEHNSGRSKFTSAFMPWEILYVEKVLDFTEGRIREKYLKSSAGKKFVQKQLQQGITGSLPA